MEDFQQRVINEKKELDGRIEKLRSFIDGKVFNTLALNERRRMNLQCKVMQEYSTILNDRIANF